MGLSSLLNIYLCFEKVKMVIYRAEPSEIETIEVELTKKSGKNLGVGFFTKNPRGLLVTDIVSRSK